MATIETNPNLGAQIVADNVWKVLKPVVTTSR